MKILKTRTAIIAIALFLTISIGTSLTLIPNATSHSPAWQIPTYAYVVGAPNPVGVGQEAHVYLWLDSVYGAAGGTTAVIGTNGSTASAALLSNNYRFRNYNLTITAPDGTTTTQVFAVISDTTSSQFTKFTPTQVGTYTLKFTFPGQFYGENGNGYEKSILIGDYYLPSSASATLTVQQDPIPAAITSYPLPTEYWTQPIYGENSYWFSISSNWLGSGSPVPAGYTSSSMYRADAVGSLTAHVMWTRELQFGGVAGGNQFVAGGSTPDGGVPGAVYFEGSSYQPRYVNPIIISGYLYYTEPRSFSGPSSGPTNCVDLRTGKIIWSRPDVPPLSFGYIYNLWDPDQHGTFPPILFTTNFARAFDAYTGDQLFNVTGVPTGTAVAGPSGEQIRYVLANAGTANNPAWHLQQWNSSKMWVYDVNPFTGAGSLSPSLINASNLALVTTYPQHPTSAAYANSITINANIPINATTLGLSGQYATNIASYDWNLSIPWRNTMTPTPTVIGANFGDIMLCRNGSLPVGFAASQAGTSQAPYTMFAVNLNASRGAVGSILWMRNYDPPAGNITMQLPSVDYQNRVFVYQYYETMQWVGFNLDTGAPMWGPTEPETAFNYYDWQGYNPGVIAYGKLYSGGFGGVLYCFNDLTGKLEWTYGNGGAGNSTYAGLNVFYGVYPSYVQNIANGVVYFAADEHTIPNPLYKGCLARALNATTGEEIWTLSEYPSEWAYSGSQWGTADGFTTFMNGLDNRIYTIGRGPSATTIQAPLTQITAGNKVVIQGTVMDVSAGTQQDEQAARFVDGIPVASDASMKDWMGYVYQQKPLPTNFTGVPISIVAIDPNNNYITLGTATTDTNGLFHYTWTTPNVPGDYTVYATFDGTNGYWPSKAVTAMTVTEAPQATAAPTLAQTSTADLYILPGIIAIILAIVLVGVVLALLMLRKRP